MCDNSKLVFVSFDSHSSFRCLLNPQRGVKLLAWAGQKENILVALNLYFTGIRKLQEEGVGELQEVEDIQGVVSQETGAAEERQRWQGKSSLKYLNITSPPLQNMF